MSVGAYVVQKLRSFSGSFTGLAVAKDMKPRSLSGRIVGRHFDLRRWEIVEFESQMFVATRICPKCACIGSRIIQILVKDKVSEQLHWTLMLLHMHRAIVAFNPKEYIEVNSSFWWRYPTQWAKFAIGLNQESRLVNRRFIDTLYMPSLLICFANLLSSSDMKHLMLKNCICWLSNYKIISDVFHLYDDQKN